MANLEFAYAAPSRVSLPAEVSKALPQRKWHVSELTFEDTRSLRALPDFTWLDLGSRPEVAACKTIIRRFAALQATTPKHVSVFISGTAHRTQTHDALVNFILRTFQDPSTLEIDLKGEPDVRAALRKFIVLRNSIAHRAPMPATSAPAAAVAPAVHVPNADLRSERGRLSIKLIAELFGMDVIEVGRAIGRDNKATLSKTPDAEALQELLKPFSDIALLRAPGFGNEQFRKWLNTPNEHMRNRAPMDWIRDGRATDVGAFVYNMLTGQPT